MPTFIKTGFWEKAKKGYKEWLNLDELIESKIPAPTPPSYKVYTALITQVDTDPPVATVLENTLGDIWFTYDTVGNYNINSNNLFTTGKTWNYISNDSTSLNYPEESGYKQITKTNSNSTLRIKTVDASFNAADSKLIETSIEIRVYT